MDYKVICLAVMTLLFSALWLLIHFKARDKLLGKVFNIFVLNMALWSFGLTMFYASADLKQSLFWIDLAYAGGGLIPPAFLLYSFVFTHESLCLSPLRIFLLFFPGILLSCLFFFTPWMIKEIAFINGVKVRELFMVQLTFYGIFILNRYF